MIFMALSLPIINGIIHVGSTRKDLVSASEWIRGKWQSMEGEKLDAIPTISALTLIYIIAKAWSRYRNDPARHEIWDSIRDRVQMLITKTDTAFGEL
jgi:hypothetical protein